MVIKTLTLLSYLLWEDLVIQLAIQNQESLDLLGIQYPCILCIFLAVYQTLTSNLRGCGIRGNLQFCKNWNLQTWNLQGMPNAYTYKRKLCKLHDTILWKLCHFIGQTIVKNNSPIKWYGICNITFDWLVSTV